MSHTQTVYFQAKRLPSIAAWQKSIEQLEFDVRLHPKWDVAKDAGDMPVVYKAKKTSFECSLEKVDPAELPDGIRAKSAEMSMAFVSRGGLSHAAAFVAAACFAKLTGGKLFDWECGDAFSANDALELAQDEYAEVQDES
jgi:hypothetical protein